MQLWFRRILFGVVALVLLVTVGLGIFLLTFNPNALKPRLQELVQQHYGRSLGIEGDIELSLFPRIGLALSGLALSGHDPHEPFLAIDNARFAVALWPLLSDKLLVDQVAISGVRLWLGTDGAGRWNFADLLGAEPAPGRAGTAAPSLHGQNFNIDIAGLAVRDGQIVLQHSASGFGTTLTGLELSTGRIASGSAFDLLLRAGVAGDPDASLQLQATVNLGGRGACCSFKKLRAEYFGAWGALERAQLKLRADLRISPAEQLQFDDLRFSLLGGFDQDADVRLDLQADGLALDALSGLQAQALRAEATLGAPRPSHFKLAVDGKDASLRAALPGADLLLDGALNLDWRARRLQLQDLRATVIAGAPKEQGASGGRAIEIGGGAALDWAQRNLKFNGTVSGAGSALRLGFTAHGWRAPRISFMLDGKRLDLRPWLEPGAALFFPAAPPAPADAAAAASQAAASRAALSWLTGFSAQGSVRLESLQLAQLQIAQLGTELVLQDQVLSLQGLRAKVFDGALSLDARLSAAQEIDGAFSLDGIELAQLSQYLAERRLLAGRARIEGALQSHGASPAQWQENLGGSLDLRAGAGRLYGLDARRSLAELAHSLAEAQEGRLSVLAAPFAQGRETPFERLQARLLLRSGSADLAHLQLDAAGLDLRLRPSGSAQIDIPARSLNMGLVAILGADISGSLGSELAPLAGARLPIRLSGDWGAPSAEVLWDEARSAPIERVRRAGLMGLLLGHDLIPGIVWPEPAPDSGGIGQILKNLIPLKPRD